MLRKTNILTGLILAVMCFACIAFFGRSYTAEFDLRKEYASADEINLVVDREGVVRITEKRLDGLKLFVRFEAVARGTTLVGIFDEVTSYSKVFYVHSLGIITEGDFFGHCTGDIVIPLAVLMFLAVLIDDLSRSYKAGVKENMYQYRNVSNLGMIIFLDFLLLEHIFALFNNRGLIGIVETLLNSASSFSIVSLPIMLITSIGVTLSNIRLVRNEGRNWRNMLGVILGFMFIFLTILPSIVEGILQGTYSGPIDIHNLNRPDYYIVLFLGSAVSTVITYLECLLIGTIVMGITAARHIPEFNKDYIMILGCQVGEDGKPTPLLKSRADRAVRFAEMQKKATGRDIIFVPSGGQGSNEIVSEGECIGNYLESIGIPKERIIVESESATTYENFRNSYELMNKENGVPKVAFSTTNFHVFRAGMLANSMGIAAEGIGAPTKSYFWINAFIREYVATISEERRRHIKVILALLLVIIFLVLIVYYSNNN